MTETMAQRGRALLIPTLHLREGRVQFHNRWQTGGEVPTGTLVEVVRTLFIRANSSVHLFLDDGPTPTNVRALDELRAAGAALIVEGGVHDLAACQNLTAAGTAILVVGPDLLDIPDVTEALAEMHLSPLLAVGTMADGEELVPRIRRAFSAGFSGLVFDTSITVDLDGLGALKEAIDKWGAELILRAPAAGNAAALLEHLHTLAPLDLTTLLDGEYLAEMLRINRSEILVARFEGSQMGPTRTLHPGQPPEGSGSSDNLWGLDETTRADLRLLLRTLKEYAGYVFLDCPVFKPFGASLDKDGAVALTVAQLEGQPGVSEYRQALVRGFRGQAERGEIRAAGYCIEGRQPLPGTPAEENVLWIYLEHRSGVSARVRFSYSVERPEKVTYDEGLMRREEPCIFSGPDPRTVTEPTTP
jgi:hypothetical protein